MKILLVTQWFNPEPNDMKSLVFAKKLKERGNEVEVLTGFPNYPTGKIYKGYKLQRYYYEEMQGIPIHRVWLFPSHDGNKLKRMLNYFSFGFSAMYYGKHKLKYDFDIVYVYHPPITSVEAAFSIAKKHNKRVFVDINDLWPESIFATKMMSTSFLFKLIEVWCGRIYRKADRINVLSEGIKKILIKKGVPEQKLSVIPVWCNEDLLSENIDHKFYTDNQIGNKFTLIYVGAVGKAQNLQIFVDVAKTLKNNKDIQILLIGTGTEAALIRQRIKENDLTNIKMLPNVPPENVVPILKCADALLIHLASDEMFKSTIPSKIPLYMATRKPIIAGLEGDAADVISKSGNIVCESENVAQLSEAVIRVYNMSNDERNAIGESGYQFFVNNMSIDNCVDRFIELFYEMIKV